ncbi:MAG: TonB-dependent receptor, partial [Bacteroidota bacterium]
RKGNFDLQHTIAWNYDAFLSFYNKQGFLITVGGFRKEIEDINFDRDSQEIIGDQSFSQQEPSNAEGIATVEGVEIEAQLNFRFLPAPFDGLLLSTNTSFIRTSTFYQQRQRLENPTRFVDSFIELPMIGQTDFIFNLSLGYERGGFTGRISYIQQGRTVREVEARAEETRYDGGFNRVDLTFKQRISKNLRLYINMNNLTNQRDIREAGPFDTRIDEFGMTADFGVQISL